MEKLHASFMRDLKNHEFEGVYCDIIKLIESKQVDDANVQLAFALIKPHEKKFEALKNRQRNKFSILNEELTHTRTDYLISLRLRVQSYLRSHKPDERVAANLINSILEIYGKKYYVPSIVTQTAFVDDIVIFSEENEDFKDAFRLLGLTDLMDTIVKMTDEIMDNYRQRINDNGESKAQRDGVRMAAYKDMKIMVDAINFMYVINKDNDEKRFVAEDLIWYINSIFKDYRTPMRSRQTKRKNRKAVATAVQELIKTQQEQQKALPVGISEELKSNESVEPLVITKKRIDSAGAIPAPENDLICKVDDIVYPNLRTSTIRKKEKEENGFVNATHKRDVKVI